jgi:hypothetical protein
VEVEVEVGVAPDSVVAGLLAVELGVDAADPAAPAAWGSVGAASLLQPAIVLNVTNAQARTRALCRCVRMAFLSSESAQRNARFYGVQQVRAPPIGQSGSEMSLPGAGLLVARPRS